MPIRRQHPDDPSFARLTLAAVGLEFGLPNLKLEREGRKIGLRQEVFARQVAVYLCQTVFNMSIPRVAELFSRDRTTITHALAVVEESREDPVFNRKLMKMEDFLLDSWRSFHAPPPPIDLPANDRPAINRPQSTTGAPA